MIKLTTILQEIQFEKPIRYPKIGETYRIAYHFNVRTIADIVDDKIFDGGKRIKWTSGGGDWSINEFLRGLKDGSVQKIEKNKLNEIKFEKYSISSEQLLELYYQKLDDVKSLVDDLPYYKLFKMKKFKEFEKLVFKHYPNPMGLGGSHPFDEKGSPSMNSFEKVIVKLNNNQLMQFYRDLLKFHI